MARVTYFGLEGAAPRLTWRGVAFLDGDAVELDEAEHAELIDQASTHPWFAVDRDDTPAGDDADEPEASALAAAAGFLLRVLANGPVPQAAVRADANASGISTATLRRAKVKLGVGAVKKGMDAGWAWALPASAEDAQAEEEPWEQDFRKAFQRIPIEPPADVPLAPLGAFPQRRRRVPRSVGREAKKLEWSVPDRSLSAGGTIRSHRPPLGAARRSRYLAAGGDRVSLWRPHIP
jgi:hypothetical protein